MNAGTAQVLRAPGDVDAVAADLAARTAAADSHQLLRLDTAYRAFSQAAVAASQPAQEALLRARIAAYFEHPAADAVLGESTAAPPPPQAAPRDAVPPHITSTAAPAVPVSAGGAPGQAAQGGTHSVDAAAVAGRGAGGREGGAPDLAGLPLRTAHSSLPLDTRELMAYARRQGLVFPSPPSHSCPPSPWAHPTCSHMLCLCAAC